MPMTSKIGATICGTRMYSGLGFVPDICDLRVSLIAEFSEFTRSTPSLTAEPTIDDSFILNQMVHNEGKIQEMEPAAARLSGPIPGARTFFEVASSDFGFALQNLSLLPTAVDLWGLGYRRPRPRHQSSCSNLAPDPNSSTGSHVDVVDLLGRKFLCGPQITDVIRVAAVNENAPRLEMRGKIGDVIIDNRGRDHQPDCSGFFKSLDDVRERCGADRLFLNQFVHRLW